MKKSIYVIALLFFTVLLSTKSFAQGHFGVKGGVNLANLNNKDFEGDALIGYQAGVVYYSNSENPLYFQTGLLYNLKGTKISLLGDATKMNLNFLEIPVNVGFKIPLGETLAISPFVGVYAGYAISGKQKYDGESFDLFEKDEDGEVLLKRFDLGGNVGLGLHLGNRAILTGQYSHGLANLNNLADESKVTTRTSTLGLTFLF